MAHGSDLPDPHTDDTQTRQNTGKPPESCKTKPKLGIQNKQKQRQTKADM